ncbi:MAG: TrkA family potassium uptake protein [Bacteroidales bacterium]|nr:TrkA family potassium uptake protein [Bacteroidales bacterium]MCF8344593.1 TrkA family potassium uptake protein [Bacteroidales bacterium]MCF8350680.1 TrkA family potassium uptake protein [Bacteroidales bacterium]MCF8376973.1 TrkA family potassium uptake protein [Bacteroidales bacterium]MCF8400874.1 TrkA family potassium uptake protein [Bacteroidales bacterium]
MKFIIIGLGNFGSTIAEKLTSMGHEVIGVDNKMSLVEAMKEKISHTICLDATEQSAVDNLPLKDTDIVMVCIGEDEGANILTTALMKQNNVKRLISRVLSPLHKTILEAMQVNELIHPEQETAARWAKKLSIKGIIDSFDLSQGYGIVEVNTPSRFVGKTLQDIAIRKNYDLTVLTTIKPVKEKSAIGITKKSGSIQKVASANTLLEEEDIMVLYGHIKDVKRMIKENQS